MGLMRVARIVQKPRPRPTKADKPQSGWKVLIGFAVGLGVVLFVAMAGVNSPAPGERKAHTYDMGCYHSLSADFDLSRFPECRG
jgi:hypothetical protein